MVDLINNADAIRKILDEILNKKFSRSVSAGYDALEVDMFLDQIRKLIVQQYDENYKLSTLLKTKENQIFDLKKQILEKERMIAQSLSEIQSYKNDGYQSQKLIKDVSVLQREVASLSEIKKEIDTLKENSKAKTINKE